MRDGRLDSAPIFPDLREFNGMAWRGSVDCVVGGFPCQPFSVAGNRRGADDPRNLWPEVDRVLREVRPQFAFLENVPGLLHGAYWGTILGDLAEGGFDVRWDCVPASAVGAPHQRDRLWILVSDANSVGRVAGRLTGNVEALPDRGGNLGCTPSERSSRMADAEGERCREAWADSERSEEWITSRRAALADSEVQGRTLGRLTGGTGSPHPRSEQPSAADPARWWATEPDVGGTLNGFSTWLDGFDMTESHKRVLAYANAEETGSTQTLRLLRDSFEEEDVQRTSRGFGGISATAVLLAYMRQLASESSEQEYLQPQGAPLPEDEVRSVRGGDEPSSSSRRSGHHAQYPREHSNPLRALSRLLALHAEKAWSRYRWENASPVLSAWLPGWEDGFGRVSSGIPARVERLGALGDAVVNQQALLAWKLLTGAVS